MSLRPHRFLFALLVGVLAVGLCYARADDAAMVKEKLFQAKKDYDVEAQNFKKAIADLFDKREDDARNAGNKKLVDQVKAERAAFEKTGEPPQTIPIAIREQMTAARTKLDKAYATAVKEYLRLKLDDAAEATEKEQQEFHFSGAILIGKRTFVSTLKPYDIKVWNNTFASNGTFNDGTVKVNKIKLNGESVPHSIFLHPPEKGFSQVRYQLGVKWTAFRATIGVPKINDNFLDPLSPLTFEVLGDDKSLWKSEAVNKLDTFQTCTINIEKLKTLTLRVHCPDNNGYACAYWFEPILIE
jgi:hypothetical protein